MQRFLARCAPQAALALGLVAVLATAGCASHPRGSDSNNNDCATQQNPKPHSYLDDWNHANFDIDLSFSRHVLRPLGKGYNMVMPAFLKQRISRFFHNLGDLPVIANDMLQVQGEPTLRTSGRFLINSTIGLFGLFDVARRLGLHPQKVREDFGLTLAHWGVGEGPYLVFPILGPTTSRASLSPLTDGLLFYPTTYISGHARTLNALYGLQALDSIGKNTKQIDMMLNSVDPYVFTRSAYLQHRRFLVQKNGGKSASGSSFDCYLKS